MMKTMTKNIGVWHILSTLLVRKRPYRSVVTGRHRKTLFSIPRLATAVLLTTFPATADIGIRISVKFILGPMGEMPSGGNGTFDEFDDITNQVTAANAVLRTTGRGYQFQIVEVTTVDGDASEFFDSPREDKEELEVAAQADPEGFKWRSNAINMYVNNADGSAICSFPTDDDILFFGQSSRETSVFHESGHFFNLRHTHQGQVACEDCTCGSPTPGNDDQILDTLPDHSCWDTADEIAQGNFSKDYNELSTSEQMQVDGVLFNMMSYHSERNWLTSDQLDRWTDTANGSRSHVVTGRTFFVDQDNNCQLPLGNSACQDVVLLEFGGPFPSVDAGVSVADADDIVLVRGGTYQEGLTIDTPVKVRATRGNAILR